MICDNIYRSFLYCCALPVDPVCGIELKQDLALSHEHKGKVFFFCCDGCKKIFMKKPKKYKRK
ncbi:MAG TPA: YHS domain-containing protein [Nitrososphaeraceae archaeon]|nr:YHS domain-containing protein [Nitrososphaeraceae archaeon]